MPQTITVEIWSDVVCPFCYIGKRHFENALNQFADRGQVQVTWKSYQLNPDLKSEPGKTSVEHLAEIKGWSLEHARQATGQVTQMARNAGLDYQLDKAVVANTMDAHRLIQLAKKENKGNEAEEELFKAYFTDSKNIADRNVLIEIAQKIGIDRALADEVLNSDTFMQEVVSDQQEAQEIGVRGVPFFVFNRRYAVSGAQPAEVFLQTLEKTAQENV